MHGFCYRHVRFVRHIATKKTWVETTATSSTCLNQLYPQDRIDADLARAQGAWKPLGSASDQWAKAVINRGALGALLELTYLGCFNHFRTQMQPT